MPTCGETFPPQPCFSRARGGVLALSVCVHRLGSRSVTASVSVQPVQAGAAMHHVSSQHGLYILHSYFCLCKIMSSTLTNTRLARG